MLEMLNELTWLNLICAVHKYWMLFWDYCMQIICEVQFDWKVVIFLFLLENAYIYTKYE